MEPKRARRSRVVGVAALIIALGAGASAQAADAQDPSAIGAIFKRSLTILGDINDTVGGALLQARASGDLQSANCLGQLRDTASEISDVLVDVNDLDTVESGMIDGRDQKFAVLIRNLSAKGATKQLAIDRRTVNQTEGECANQGLVQQKARDLIQLIDDATAELETMK